MKIKLLNSLLSFSFVNEINIFLKKGGGKSFIDTLFSNKKGIKEIPVIEENVYADSAISVPIKKNKIRVLLVDDNKANQVLISDLLKKEKYQFDIVKNGREAICAFEASVYDLIIMDINIPVLDGEEATKTIRKINKQIPILALTADEVSNELFEDKFFMGFNDVISKPLNKEDFLTTINNLITLTKRSFVYSSSRNKVALAS
ncbi:response regulator [uncultured Algibacter sp.]|uniref:response regulator n=1 Tax=uncultured Algibacter sp. TaxID=298659 RepID=UPI0026398A92|nr:response regulator [uncultured Algibacter sp.]